ncbi:MAG TPA: glycosyltransferase family 39 protein [Rhodocyclaceae bacterium]|jgi:4-amino-4-deoxy-L-arabinose transferase-like glycosyltransferase
MKSRAISWLLLLAIVSALGAAWFGTLNERKLVRPDEGRYAEIPREMVVSGDWVTPRLNGIKYFEKPALQYWTTAAAYEVFGESQWTARIWPALTGFGGILLAWFLGYRLWGQRAGILAGAILASTLLYNVMGHIITLDMSLSFFLQMAWTGFILAQIEPDRSRKWMWMAWAGLALAALSKGLVAGVLTGGVLVAYSIINRDISPWKRFAPLSGFLIFLAIAAPWFIVVSLANPEFPHFFFIHEHFERFLTKVHHRYQPNWYFVPIYFLGALPWAFLALHALTKSWTERIAGKFNPERFLLLWTVLTFVFFSVSSSKLPPYILPIFPALALLGGKVLYELPRKTLLIHLGLLLLIAAAALWFAPQMVHEVDADYNPEMMQGLAKWLTGAAIVWAITLVLTARLVWQHMQLLALVVLAAGSFIAGTGILLGHDKLHPFNSAWSSAEKIRPLLTPGVPFYSVQWYEQTLPFYIKRNVTLVEYQDEMAFGIEQEPDKWIPTVAEFKQRWLTDKDAFAMVSISNFNGLKAEGFPMEEISRDQRNVYIRKPQAPAADSSPAVPSPVAPSSAVPAQ